MHSYVCSLKFLLPRVFGLNRLNLVQSPHVPLFIGECSAKKSVDQFLCKRNAYYARSQHEDIHVIMLHSLMGGVGVMTKSGANPWDLVCRDRNSYAAAAHEDSPVSPFVS